MSSSSNIARHLPAMAAQQPERAALKIPRGRTKTGSIDYVTLSFAELDAEVNAWVARMTKQGIRRGDRTLVMVKQGLPLIASVFALFKCGAVPVVIDPGMGLKSFLRCVKHAQPRALVGIPAARLISRLARKTFASILVRVAASSKLTARLTRPAAGSTRPAPVDPTMTAETGSDELAAVLFTSGSTGAPKGVCYTHGMFDAQVHAIRDAYQIEPGEIDLPLLPIFALFNPALGMTTIVPEIDPRRPSEMDPAKIVQALLQEKVTNSFGSPTLWRMLADHLNEHALTLPSLKRVLCAGAPVPPALWQASTHFLTHGLLHSPYGATEALPVSSIASNEVVGETAAATRAGAGTCVGRPVVGVEVKIVAVSDGPMTTLEEACELPNGTIGEIVVRGPMVTQKYDNLPDATALSKIASDDLRTKAAEASVAATEAARAPKWHRMGDCGYLDTVGRLWFCGRKAERVQMPGGTLFTEQVEPLFNQHTFVRRSALVGIGLPGRQRPVIVVEEPIGVKAIEPLKEDILAWVRNQPQRVDLTVIKEILFHPRFPVDVRHNAKIHRLTLAKWAEHVLNHPARTTTLAETSPRP